MDHCTKREAQVYSDWETKGKENQRKGHVYQTRTYPGKPQQIIPSDMLMKLEWCLQKFRIENNIRIDCQPGMYEFQMATYGVGDHFKLHRDMNPSLREFIREREIGVRKISSTILLSDIDDYEGGGFRLETPDQKTIRVESDIGDVVMFPHWLQHQVDPITKGERNALVTWMLGDFWT